MMGFIVVLGSYRNVKVPGMGGALFEASVDGGSSETGCSSCSDGPFSGGVWIWHPCNSDAVRKASRIVVSSCRNLTGADPFLVIL